MTTARSIPAASSSAISASGGSIQPSADISSTCACESTIICSASSVAPAEEIALEADEQVVRGDAQPADDHRSEHHVVHLEPCPRVVDQVAQASVGSDELGGDDDKEPDREPEPQPDQNVRQSAGENHVSVDAQSAQAQALGGSDEHGVHVPYSKHGSGEDD